MSLPKVAIVGRPNTGKSTLFNRIVGGRKAIVDDIPGVTRDWLSAEVEWNGKTFTLIDTGGFDPFTEEPIHKLVMIQTERAIEEADLIIAVFDGKAGLTPLDEELVNRLRKINKVVFYAINKCDAQAVKNNLPDFYSTGIDRFYMISAEHGDGVEELLNDVASALPKTFAPEKEALTRIVIIGRPNVGKSTLTNTLLGEERVITSEIPGTTRDSIEVEFEWKKRRYILVDTAGIRRKSKVKFGLELFSVKRAIQSIESADIVILLGDITEGVVEQDMKVLSLSLRRGKGVIFALNKADLLTQSQRKKVFEEAKYRLQFADFVPILWISALKGEGVDLLMGTVRVIEDEMNKKIKTSLLNRVIQEAMRENLPPLVGRRRFKVYYAVHKSSKPPTFLLFCNDPELIKKNYLSYLENRLREKFLFTGLPIFVKLIKSE